jgi:hypothetical protein
MNRHSMLVLSVIIGFGLSYMVVSRLYAQSYGSCCGCGYIENSICCGYFASDCTSNQCQACITSCCGKPPDALWVTPTSVKMYALCESDFSSMMCLKYCETYYCSMGPVFQLRENNITCTMPCCGSTTTLAADDVCQWPQ